MPIKCHYCGSHYGSVESAMRCCENRFDDDDPDPPAVVTDGGYPHTTTDKSDVNVPDWASDLEVGDVIRWETSSTDGFDKIVGFSTVDGLPVITAPRYAIDDIPDEMVTCTIPERNYVEVVQDQEASA